MTATIHPFPDTAAERDELRKRLEHCRQMRESSYFGWAQRYWQRELDECRAALEALNRVVPRDFREGLGWLRHR